MPSHEDNILLRGTAGFNNNYISYCPRSKRFHSELFQSSINLVQRQKHNGMRIHNYSSYRFHFDCCERSETTLYAHTLVVSTRMINRS